MALLAWERPLSGCWMAGKDPTERLPPSPDPCKGGPRASNPRKLLGGADELQLPGLPGGDG